MLLPNNFPFLLFCLLVRTFSAANGMDYYMPETKSANDCPRDLPKGREGQICYPKLDGSQYFFVGKKIAGEPDSKIYKVKRFLSGGIVPADRSPGKAFAVKVVSTGPGARMMNLAKPAIMIRHELNMLEAFNRAQHGRPIAEHSVVKLFGGGEVIDPSPMVVEHARIPLVHVDLKREFSMLYVMEFGDRTLDRHLEEWDRKLIEGHRGVEEAKMDPEQLVAKLAETLNKFHKYALHLHLKPGNWIWVRSEDKWKLIDLQSAIPNLNLNDPSKKRALGRYGFLRSDDEKFPDDLVEFACNSLANELFLTQLVARANERPSTYASPEHADACRKAHPMLRGKIYGKLANGDRRRRKMEAQLMRIGPKADVWSLGILALEILAHTPQVNPPEQRQNPVELFVKVRAEFAVPAGRMKVRQRLEEAAHFRGRRPKFKKWEGGQNANKQKMGKFMKRVQANFPNLFRALMKIFIKDPNRRADVTEVRYILNGGDTVGSEPEKGKNGISSVPRRIGAFVQARIGRRIKDRYE